MARACAGFPPYRDAEEMHERRRKTQRLILAILAGLISAATIASTGVAAKSPYSPYEFLIGRWDIAPESGGPPVARATFRWGPGSSYIWYAGSLLVEGAERPHFEGLLVWNGVRKNLDMLLTLDLEGGLVQEQGRVFVENGGTVVREITATYSEGARPIDHPAAGPAGATARFRQTFRKIGPDRISTQVMRQSGRSWVATFPGSDRLVMTRRSND
jgi:hypothetical protein